MSDMLQAPVPHLSENSFVTITLNFQGRENPKLGASCSRSFTVLQLRMPVCWKKNLNSDIISPIITTQTNHLQL